MQRNLIIIRYLKSWFFIDFLTSIPAYSLFYIHMNENVYLTVNDLLTYHTQSPLSVDPAGK